MGERKGMPSSWYGNVGQMNVRFGELLEDFGWVNTWQLMVANRGIEKDVLHRINQGYNAT